MATLTAGAGSTTWTTASFSGGAASTAADEVIVPTGASLTISSGNTPVCRSFSVTGTGTIIFASSTANLTIGDGTAGTGNVAFSIASGGTLTQTAGTSTISFVSTSATQQTITTAGKTMPSITINGAGSSYILGDALIMNTSNVATTLTVTNGTFNTGNYNVTGNIINTATGTKTVTLGSSAVSLARNGAALDFSASTGLTMTANTSVITFTQSATVNGGGVNFNGASWTFTGAGTKSITGANTVANITVTGTAAKTGILSLSANQTCTGTFTANSNSDVNRIMVASDTRGTARTITAATAVIGNTVDFMDITGAGAATWTVAGTGATYLGDCQGNSGITFTTPTTCYAKFSASSNWSSAIWYTTSGGSTPERVPLPQDDVVFDANSTATASRAISFDMPRAGKNINLSNVLSTTNFGLSITTDFFGSWNMSTSIVLTQATGVVLRASGRSSYTITSGGNTFSSSSLTIDCVSGTYTLADALTLGGTTPGVLSWTSGTFTTNNYNIACGSVSSGSTGTRVANLGTSTITINGTNAIPWSMSATLTLSAASSTIVIATASGYTRTFASGNQTYGTLTYTVANSGGPLSISGSSTYGTINLGAGRALIPNSSGVYTFTGTITGSGSPNGYVYMPGDSYGASIPDSAALSIAGDMDFRQRMSFDSLVPSGSTRIAGKFLTTGNQRTWRLYLTGGTGTLTLDMSTTGSDSSTAQSSVTLSSLGLTANTNYWIRFTREKTTGNVKFYYAADNASMPSSWTQIGTTQVATTSNLFDSTALLTIGGEQAGTNSNPGRYYRSQLRNNILDDGTGIQFDADFTAKTFGADTFTESSSNAATVTMANNSLYGDGRIQINASSAGSVATLTKASGGPINTTSDYLVIKDIKVPQPYFFFAGANSVSQSGNTNISLTTPPSAPLLRQSAPLVTVSGNTTGTITYPAATTSGNLLCIFWGGATAVSNLAASGWTLGDFKTGTGTSVGVLYKIADGTETSVAVTWTTSASPQLYAYEISGFTGTPTLDTFNESTSASATSLATGAATNSTAPGISIVAFSGNGSMGASSTVPTNSFQEDYNSQQATGSVLKFGLLPLTTSASRSTTFTWTTSRVPVSVLVNFVNASSSNSNFLVFM